MASGPVKRKSDDVQDDACTNASAALPPTSSSLTRGQPAVPLQGSHVTGDTPPVASNSTTPEVKPICRVKKLVPPRPFPTVPTSVSATGPRSAHHEGKNYIAVTRKTGLGAYLRRCKDLVLKDGYKSIHLNAMGAAIPHLTTLALSIPAVLPFAADEISTEVLTGTVEVQDELLPDDEDEDISYRTRGKSTLSIVMTIGDGMDEKPAGGSKWGARGKRRGQGLSVPGPEPKKGANGAHNRNPNSTSQEAMDTS
ncbi:hypothetical protein OF83DRAFT_1143535 [Amylostereum chailletii]|nr:hypothetical protein OF83DRAFT_1143535 [Amylostereum chailletii]